MPVLSDRRALVTGAAGGIGAQIVRRFVEEGARVLATDVDPLRLAEVAGERVSTFSCDLASADCADALIEAALETLGGLDVLVNNAGLVDGLRTLREVSDEIWERTLAVNLTAPMRLTRRALEPMLAQGGGVIVTVASIAGQFGARGGVAYTASKHGLIGLMRALAVEHGADGIRSNLIAPGFVDTEFGTRGPQPHKKDLDALLAMLSTNPRTASPEEIADVAVFLASDAARSMNGSVVVADGGWTAL